MRKAIMVFLLFYCTGNAFCQQKDTLQVYRKIEKAASKSKLTRWMYRNIFNLPSAPTNSVKKIEKVKKQHIIEDFEGRVIRSIRIYTYDPFGFSLEDTTKKPASFIQKVGNAIHARTSTAIIRNQLLFREGDTLDPLEVKESARILRTLPYIRDAQVRAVPSGRGKDSVDVGIFVSDVWTISGGISYSSDLIRVKYSDKNFGGLGHQMFNQFNIYRDRGYSATNGYYRIPAIGRTFISATAYFNSDPYNFQRGVAIERPFYSPLTKWAGGVDLFDVRAGAFSLADENHYAPTVRYNNFDFWSGRSYSIDNDTAEEIRTTKVILAARYQHLNFLDGKDNDTTADPLAYSTTNLFIGSVAISARTYYRDYFIYRYGIQEDVPVGRLIRLDVGVERRGDVSRPYLGTEYRTGNHFDNFGYAYTGFSLGSYLNQGKLQQSVFRIGIGYFSDLLGYRKIRFRQFVKTNITYGFNRLRGESITLNETSRGLPGFDTESDELRGVKKAVISLQSQFYLPYNIIGFRFAPFLFASLGQIAGSNERFFESRFYQSYGIGLLVQNELLVINTFQFSFGWYPHIPGQGSDIRFNPIRTYNFTFDDFAVAKPSPITYD